MRRHRNASSAPPRRRAGGFTMVEALVALVVLAIGLLGIAALYLDSLRGGRTAIYRSQAVMAAADLADRIRNNRSAVAGYATAFATTVATVAACETTAGCTAAEQAQNDLARWKAVLASVLPAGQGSVATTAGTPNVYVITVQWTEAGQDTPASFALRVET